MNIENKIFIKEILINLIGTLISAGILAALAFLIKANFIFKYWKGLTLILVVIFIVINFIRWFKRLIYIEEELKVLKNFFNTTKQPNYFNEIALLKNDLTKKADKSSVPNNSIFNDLERTVKELTIFMHSQKGQMGEIIGLISLLKEDIDKDNWQIIDVLEDLERSIGGISLDSKYIADIEEQLCRLDNKPKYNFLVNKIRKHYQPST